MLCHYRLVLLQGKLVFEIQLLIAIIIKNIIIVTFILLQKGVQDYY